MKLFCKHLHCLLLYAYYTGLYCDDDKFAIYCAGLSNSVTSDLVVVWRTDLAPIYFCYSFCLNVKTSYVYWITKTPNLWIIPDEDNKIGVTVFHYCNAELFHHFHFEMLSNLTSANSCIISMTQQNVFPLLL